MKRIWTVLFVAILVGCGRETWQRQPAPLQTRWAKHVSPHAVWPEYPRPLLQREHWLNLNGLWDYAILPADSNAPAQFQGKILVPFPVESALSGVAKRVSAGERLWYRRRVELPSFWEGKRILLHFEAVDWQAEVWVNGKKVGEHRGGYDPFTFEITEFVKNNRWLEILVKAFDPTDNGWQARGKQVSAPRGIWYTPTSGIWQTVWLEAVPEVFIRDLQMIPDADSGRLKIRVSVDPPGAEVTASVAAFDPDGNRVAEITATPDCELNLTIPQPRLWSPDDPILYDLEIQLLRGHDVLDEVKSYFGLRQIALGKDDRSRTCLTLNGRPLFQMGPLDQGFWPDGLYTPPSDDAMRFDLEMIKKLGFNMLRKHVKVESRRFYYWCDRLGLLVWQDMPSASRPAVDTVAADALLERDRQFEWELREMVKTLFNHPSIVLWVPFNEGWGQYDTPRIVSLIRELDPTRLIDNASGWTDRGVGDVVDVHRYPGPDSPEPETDRAAVLGEFGGLGLVVAGHTWQKTGWGYDLMRSREQLLERYEELWRQVFFLRKKRGLSAAVYTQITDVETENNGLLTYDREILKIDPELAKKAHLGLLPPVLLAEATIFLDSLQVALAAPDSMARIVYTTDGGNPGPHASLFTEPFRIRRTTTVKARCIWPDGRESRTVEFTLKKVKPRAAVSVANPKEGLRVAVFTGDWQLLPDFAKLSADSVCVTRQIGLIPGLQEDFGLVFQGYVRIPKTAVYRFALTSDDGSRLFLDGKKLIDNDGIHGPRRLSETTALAAGFHRLELHYFQRKGGKELRLEIRDVETKENLAEQTGVFYFFK